MFGLFKKKDKKMDKGVENTIKELREMNKQLLESNKLQEGMIQFQNIHIEELGKQLLSLQKDDGIDRELFINYAWCYVGTWYAWGGDNPAGFDCSGLVNEGLQAVGKIGRKEDLTAEGLKERFINNRVDKPYRGCLALWGNTYNKKIIHVEICLDSQHALGASGGGSKVVDIESAKKQNAFIKVRPIDSRPLLWGYVDPFLKKEIE